MAAILPWRTSFDKIWQQTTGPQPCGWIDVLLLRGPVLRTLHWKVAFLDVELTLTASLGFCGPEDAQIWRIGGHPWPFNLRILHGSEARLDEEGGRTYLAPDSCWLKILVGCSSLPLSGKCRLRQVSLYRLSRLNGDLFPL